MPRYTEYLRFGILGLAFTSSALFAQHNAPPPSSGYPSKPIRVLVGVTPGGGLDTITRIVSQKLGERLAQSFIVDNRPGAASTIAMKLAATASPDGYTLMSATKTMILNGVFNRVQFDVLQAYIPVVAMTTQAYVMVVNPSVPVKSITDLVRREKAAPGTLNYGSAGIGSLQHVGMEHFNQMSGAKIVHVPYKGGGAAIIDLLAGQIQVMPSVTISVGTYIRNGKLKAIAVTSLRRVQVFPDIPTVSESGVPGFELVNLYGLYAPAGTAPHIISTLNTEVLRVMGQPDLEKAFAADGVEAQGQNTPEQFRTMVTLEFKKWSEFARTSRIKF